MTCLLLEQPDYQLSLHEGLLRLSHPTEPPRLFALGHFQQILLTEGVQLSSELLLALSAHGISVLITGQRSCVQLFDPRQAPNGLRLAQYRAISQEACRQQLVWRLLFWRRKGQNRLLARLGAAPLPPLPEQGNPMLVEAELSRRYWQAWANRFAVVGFAGRQRRPAPDPLNALLSLTSTLEDQALLPPMLAEGFDPVLGFHHSTGYQRASLLLDIKELTRAELEGWVLDVWEKHLLTPQHFHLTAQGCRLTRAGQQIFYPRWFSWQKQRKAHLRHLVRLCRRQLEQVLRHVG